MIEIDDVTFGYPEAERPVLRGVSLRVEEGELVLVSGRTGTGKSTLLGLVNGLVPQFTGGRLSGDVRIHGRSIRGTPPRELAHLVGYVGQDPLAGFVTDTVEEELAYGMEQLGLPPATMRRRVEETLDLLGIADLRTRDLASLSGGQQQRVALGSVLTMHPRVLVLDEPTSALDPTAAEEVLATLTRLVHDAGLSVVVAEHRLERVLPFADRVVRLVGDGTVVTGSPGEVVADGVAVPPLVELGRWAGWSPLPLSVRDARRAAGALRSALPAPGPGVMPASRPLAEIDDVSLMRDQTLALRSVSVSLGSGLVTAVMGRNGSGKSSLFWTIQGSLSRTAGRVRVEGEDPASASASRRRALVGLVPQTAADLLYLETVAEECVAADSAAGAAPGHTRELLASLVPGIPPEAHPRDLSEGQRLALALAVVLSTRPRVLLLDEPTRGLDYPGKSALARVLRGLAAEGRAVAVATHDVEFVAEAADQVVVLADGEVISAGPVAEVVAQSPAFAPQVSKVLGPGWLTVAQVAAAVEDSAASGEGS